MKVFPETRRVLSIWYLRFYWDKLWNLHMKNIMLRSFFSLWIHIQYWCIDGKYRIYVARLRNGGKTSFVESSNKKHYVTYIVLVMNTINQ